MPDDKKYTIDQLLQRRSTSSILINDNNHHHPNNLSFSSSLQLPAENITKKRQTISISSDDDIVELVPETDCQRILKKRSTKQKVLSPRKRDELIDKT
jgi:hypothetical protein